MDIRFYKKNNRWYADIPKYIEDGGTEDDCEMVAGADEWLDIISDKSNEIVIKISSEKELSEKIERYHHDEYGATYIANTFKGKGINHELWLCPVTIFVFNEYPKTIYYSLN